MSIESQVPLAVTIDVRDSCYCLHLQRAARMTARRYDEALRPFGLTNGQFSMLMALNTPEPTTMGRVSTLLGMDRTTLTAALKPLERRGLAQIQINSTDKRSRKLILTAVGHDLLLAALPTWRKMQKEIDRIVSDAKPDRFRADLRALGAVG
jgi:DNA-binding MarR family transcriptional regulator